MKTVKYVSCLLIVSVYVLQSCSIEKRHYTNGYHLVVNSKHVDVSNQYAELTHNSSFITHNSLTASSDRKKGVVLLAVDSMGCDTLIMRDGTEIKAKVTEVTPTEIKYKYCNNIDGPTYVVNRYLVSYIKYRNGTLDSFINEHPPIAQPNNRNNGNYNQNNRGSFNGNSVDNFNAERYVERLSTKSLVLGLISLIIGGFGVISAIFAIIRGAEALRLIKQDPANLWRYRQRAMAGIILGIVFLAIALLAIVMVILQISGII